MGPKSKPHTYIYIYIQIYIYIYIWYICTYIYIYIHIYTHTHTHRRVNFILHVPGSLIPFILPYKPYIIRIQTANGKKKAVKTLSHHIIRISKGRVRRHCAARMIIRESLNRFEKILMLFEFGVYCLGFRV